MYAYVTRPSSLGFFSILQPYLIKYTKNCDKGDYKSWKFEFSRGGNSQMLKNNGMGILKPLKSFGVEFSP